MKATICLAILIFAFLPLTVAAQASKNFQLNPDREATPDLIEGEKYALLIGVKAYSNGIRPLKYTENDIKSLYNVLVDPTRGGFPSENVTVLSDSASRAPTLIEINKALHFLASTTNKNDMVLVYFSGHGETDGELSYLLTPDTDPAALQFSALPVSMFNRMVRRIPARKKVIILDACHAGGVSMQTKGGGAMTTDMYSELHARSEGEVRLLSCGERDLSYETEALGGGRGVFSYYLVKALSTPVADKDGNGLVTITEIEDYVKLNVSKWAGRQGWRQTPTSEKKIEGMIVLGKVSRSIAKENATMGPQAAIAESLSAKARKDGSTTTDLETTRLSTKYDEIRSSLPAKTVLLEFVRYTSLETRDFRYGVIIVPSEGGTRSVPLVGSAFELEQAIQAYQKLTRPRLPTDDSAVGASEREAEILLHDLFRIVWEPVAVSIPDGTETVVIKTDGQLNFLSFATLLTARNEFLAEQFRLVYVDDVEELMSDSEVNLTNDMLLIGDPDFGSISSHDTALINFPPIPYSRTECLALKEWRTERSLGHTTILLGEDATEANLRSHSSPAIIHLVTQPYSLGLEYGQDPLH